MQTPEFGIVLCAGLGVRLRPLTDMRPKPLLPFLDRPIASYAVDALCRLGVTSIGANAHHHHEQVSTFFEQVEAERAKGSQIRTSVTVEKDLLGTGGGAKGVWKHLGSPRSTVVVLNGDVVADIDLSKMLKVHRRTGARATLLARPSLKGEAAVMLDESRHFVAQVPGPNDPVTTDRYRPKHPVTFGGVYMLEPDVFDAIPDGNVCLIRNGIANVLRKGGLVAAFEHQGFWADVGTATRFLQATFEVLDDAARMPNGPLPVRESRRWVSGSRGVHPDAKLEPPVYIAEGAVVEADAHVGPYAVVGAGSTIRNGARVAESVVAGTDVRGRAHRQVLVDERALRAR